MPHVLKSATHLRHTSDNISVKVQREDIIWNVLWDTAFAEFLSMGNQTSNSDHQCSTTHQYIEVRQCYSDSAIYSEAVPVKSSHNVRNMIV